MAKSIKILLMVILIPVATLSLAAAALVAALPALIRPSGDLLLKGDLRSAGDAEVLRSAEERVKSALSREGPIVISLTEEEANALLKRLFAEVERKGSFRLIALWAGMHPGRVELEGAAVLQEGAIPVLGDKEIGFSLRLIPRVQGNMLAISVERASVGRIRVPLRFLLRLAGDAAIDGLRRLLPEGASFDGEVFLVDMARGPQSLFLIRDIQVKQGLMEVSLDLSGRR